MHVRDSVIQTFAQYICEIYKTIWLKANGTLLLGRNDDNETYKTHKETVPEGKVKLYVLNNILAGLPEMEGLFFCPNPKGRKAKIEN